MNLSVFQIGCLYRDLPFRREATSKNGFARAKGGASVVTQ